MRKKGKQTKLPKKYWEKGKSKYLAFRPELKNKIDTGVNIDFKKEEETKILANKERRKNLKINQEKHHESYYDDCHINLNT